MTRVSYNKRSTVGENDIIKALENSKYTWRTIRGIANELNVSPQDVEQVIMRLKASKVRSGLIVRSSRLSKNGEELYTTRSHYRRKASPFIRIVGALRNRVY